MSQAQMFHSPLSITLQDGLSMLEYLACPVGCSEIHPTTRSRILCQVNHFGQPNAWGDFTALTAAAEAYSLQICLLSTAPARAASDAYAGCLRWITPTVHRATIYIGHIHNKHFVVLWPDGILFGFCSVLAKRGLTCGCCRGLA